MFLRCWWCLGAVLLWVLLFDACFISLLWYLVWFGGFVSFSVGGCIAGWLCVWFVVDMLCLQLFVLSVLWVITPWFGRCWCWLLVVACLVV